MKKKAKRSSAKKATRAKNAVKAKSAASKSAKSKSARKAARKSAKPVQSEKARLARNKKLVLEFYERAINQKDFDAARKYMADDYKQHNPTAADGPEGLRVWLQEFKRMFPNLHATVKRCIAEGDYVVLHVLGENGPCPHGTAVIDIFRVENGKVAEHWDVIQDIPAEIKNPNSMF